MIYLFGGSFNPFHIEHEKCVNEIKLLLKNDDKIMIVPVYSPWKPQEFLNIDERIDLIKYIYQNDSSVSVSNLGKDSLYMFDIVDKVKAEYKQDICLVMGQDTFESVAKWHRYEECKNNVKITIIPRVSNISSTLIRNNLINNKNLLSDKASEYLFDVLKK
jgi:nicotinate-nucleotide adenylyltransferase